MSLPRRSFVPGLLLLPKERLRASLAWLLAAALAVGAGTPLRATAGGDARVRLVAKDEPVRDVLLRLGEETHTNITVDDGVHGTVTIALHDATASEAMHAICSQLGLRCTREGRTIFVSLPTSAVLQLSIVPARRAAAVVARLFPHLAAAPGPVGNTLILTGPQADIEAARSVVQSLDVRDATKPITEAIGLRAEPARVVAARLASLYPAARIIVASKTAILVSATPNDLAQMKAAVAGIEATQPAATTLPLASDAVNVVQRLPRDVARSVAGQIPHLHVSVSGSAVVIAGTPDDVARAKAMIAALDVPPFGARVTQIYRLVNVDATSVAALVQHSFPQVTLSVDATLNAISVTATAGDQQRIAVGIAQLDGTGNTGNRPGEEGQSYGAGGGDHAVIALRSITPGNLGGSSTTSAQDIATAVLQSLQTTHPDLHVTVPNGMQTIVLTGSVPAVREAKELIKELDIVPPSVVLDTEILELDENSSRNLGLELGTTSIGTTFTEVQPTAGPDGTAGRLIKLGALTRTPISFQAQINLLLQNGKARVLADPRITTLSGRTATIRAGDTISILTTVGGGTGTVATTQLESFQTGVTLDITPIVTDDGDLSVALHPVVNSLTGYLNGVPQISTRDTQTTVHLHDAQTLVIGGLIQESSQHTESKIPFVGDFPIIGPLFRNENTTTTRNELVMVITPHLLADSTPSDAARPPGIGLPSPRPLPTLPPELSFPSPPPVASLATPRPAHASAAPSPGASTVPAPSSLPSAFAQANSFVFGAAPTSTYAGPNDAPQIFYAMLSPTVFSPTATVRVSAITTTNVQRLVVSSGAATVGLTSFGPGQWQGVFSANILGLPATTSSLHLALVASRSDGQSASIPITVSIIRSSDTGPTL